MNKEEEKITDDNIDSKLKDARNDFDAKCNIYRNYVGKAETFEERKKRINRFRCGGF